MFGPTILDYKPCINYMHVRLIMDENNYNESDTRTQTLSSNKIIVIIIDLGQSLAGPHAV